MTRFPLHLALLSLTLAGPARADGQGGIRREEIPLGTAAAKTLLFPAWNSIETGEGFLAFLQVAADAAAVAGIGLGLGLSLSTGPEDGDALVSGILVAAGAGTAALNRAISLPLNLASTLQHNSEIRSVRRGAGGSPGHAPGLEISLDRSPGNPAGTLRRFGLGLGAGNVDGFAAERAYWDASLSLKGARLSLTARYRMETPVYYYREEAGEWRMKADEQADFSLIPEYLFDLPRGFYAKAGVGFSGTTFWTSSWRTPGGSAPMPEPPDWDRVFRIEPAAALGRSWWDNKVTTEVSLGLTAWDSRFADTDARDRLPFGWGAPVEPAFRVFYWL